MRQPNEYDYQALRETVEVIGDDKKARVAPGATPPPVTQADIKRSRNPQVRRQNVLLKRRMGQA